MTRPRSKPVQGVQGDPYDIMAALWTRSHSVADWDSFEVSIRCDGRADVRWLDRRGAVLVRERWFLDGGFEGGRPTGPWVKEQER